MNQQTIFTLIKRCNQGDQKAFRTIVEHHQPFVYSLSFRMLGSHEEANDAVQEIFIRVWKNLPKFNGTVKFSTWLYKITSNHCIDRIKIIKRQRINIIESPDKINFIQRINFDDPEKKIIEEDLTKVIRWLSGQLSPKQKLVFTLSELEQLDIDEIIEITGLSAAKIKSNLYCARQFIREKLKNL